MLKGKNAIPTFVDTEPIASNGSRYHKHIGKPLSISLKGLSRQPFKVGKKGVKASSNQIEFDLVSDC